MASTRKGSDYLAADAEISIGFCKDHARTNEAYCEECRIVICPSCLMFGVHQGHKVLPPGQAARMIREKIDNTNKSGRLRPDYSERFLLDIRDSKIKLNKAQAAVMNQQTESFKNIIKTIKARKIEIEDSICDHYINEFEVIGHKEKSWEEKQSLAKEVLEFSNSPSDDALLCNSFMILLALDSLDEQIKYININLLTRLNFTINHQGDKIEFADLLMIFETIGEFGDIKKLQFRS